MKFGTMLCAGLLTAIAGEAVACDLPVLVAIPGKDAVAGQEQQIREATAAYFQSMQTYTACVQAELNAAGGDKAQPIVKTVLVQRNNFAVAEAQNVLKLFNANVGAAPAVGPPQGAAPAEPANNDRKRDKDK